MKNKFKELIGVQLDEHLSNFPIDHVSYSSIESFVKNEIIFFFDYIVKDRDNRSSASALSWKAYHYVLEKYFKAFKNWENLDIDDLHQFGFDRIEKFKPWDYLITKKYEETGIDWMKLDVTKALNQWIKNFWKEKDKYFKDIKEIIAVEWGYKDFIEFKYIDWDCPIPLKFYYDLLYINHSWELVVLDHKLRSKKLSTAKEILLKSMTQTLCYIMWIEADIERTLKMKDNNDIFYQFIKKYPKMKEGVKSFVYVENKVAMNRDWSDQMDFLPINVQEYRPMLEKQLYDKLSRVVRAVSDVNYTYLINIYDLFSDLWETYDKWLKYFVNDSEPFEELTDAQKVRIAKFKEHNSTVLKLIKEMPESALDQLKKSNNLIFEDMKWKTPRERIEFTLRCLSVPAVVEEVIKGYSCNMYLLRSDPWVSSKAIISKKMDIAQAIWAESVRIPETLVKYEWEFFIWVEANKERTWDEEILVSPKATKDRIPLGQDIHWNPICWEIWNPSCPHILIAGATWSGKSISVENIIAHSMSQKFKITILDPKGDFEEYKWKIDVFNDFNEIENFINWLVDKMEKIYKKHWARGFTGKRHLVIFDESWSAFAVKKQSWERSLKENMLILAQKARSARIHLLLSAQRFTAKVFNWDLKANFSTRLCFTTASKIDSISALDEIWAEDLNWLGDWLFKSPSNKNLIRIQWYMN